MFKDKQHMLNEILCLMDKVREHLKHDSNIDNFIDNDDEIDRWAKIIPKSQYPIFIISSLTNEYGGTSKFNGAGPFLILPEVS